MRNAKDDTRRLMKERAAADMLAVSVRTLQTWRVVGQGPPFIKMGSAVRYDTGDVAKWINQQRRERTA